MYFCADILVIWLESMLTICFTKKKRITDN
jgi:hypothetical protein